eukprot:scaffold1803_cov92-Amphora_coffeaeformis.AAC.6
MAARHSTHQRQPPRLVLTAAFVLFVGLLCVGTSFFLFAFVSLPPTSSLSKNKIPTAKIPGPASSSSSSSAAAAADTEQRQQTAQRIGIVLPFVGNGPADIPPYLGLFCTGAVGASNVADFLLFHNGVLSSSSSPSSQHTTSSTSSSSSIIRACEQAPNVKLINLQSTVHLMELVATALLDRVEDWAIPRDRFIPFLARHTDMLPYTLVEYKPALGHIFAKYLTEYSHWAYSDLDVLWGNVGRHLQPEDWVDFDIVTWGFGDQQRLYLRGQFTMHRNDPQRINQLWRDCPYLSRIDERFARAVKQEEEFKLESAEGCYSVAVLQYNDLAIKYATAAWTDIDKTTDTAFSHGIQLVRDVTKKSRHLLVKRAGATIPAPSVDQISYHRLADSPLYRDDSLPWQEPIGAMEPISLPRDAHQEDDPCQFFWIQQKYRPQLCLPEALDTHETIYWVKGQLSKQETRDLVIADGLLTGPFFHFQEWKRHFMAHQLTAVLDPQWSSILLTQHGGLPVKYNDPTTSSNIRKRQSHQSSSSLSPSPLGLALEQHWKGDLMRMLEHDELEAESHRLRLLPRNTYCLLHGEPQRFHTIPCEDAVVWSDTERIQILSAAPAWNKLDVEQEVTLCLTLHIAEIKATTAWADLLADNLDNWQGQPAVVVVSLQGLKESQTEQAVAVLQEKLKSFSDTAFVAVIFPKENEEGDGEANNLVSRKALMNMATDMSPTRWYVYGMEVERGLVLSRDSVVLALRAAATSVQSGRILWVAQYGLNDNDTSAVSATTISLKDLVQARGQDTVQSPWRFDKPCPTDSKRGEGDHLSSPHILWWLTSMNLVAPDKKRVTDEEIRKRAESTDEMNQDALKILQTPESLLVSEESPILLVDNTGPYMGIRAHTFVREVEAFAGVRCFHLLRMALLIAGGYQLGVLEGAFATSSQDTRKISPEYSSTKCDGCPVLEGHSKTKDALIQSEVQRIVNTVIVWDTPASNSL